MPETGILVHQTGILKLDYEVSEEDMRRNRSISLTDFLGNTFTIPKDIYIDYYKPFVIPNRGYVNWCSQTSKSVGPRQDLLVRLNVTSQSEFNRFGW